MDYSPDSLFTCAIFFLGAVTVILSIIVSHKFTRYCTRSHSSQLATAVAWQLAGEAVIGLGTLLFAGAAHLGALPDWPQWVQSWIRFIMFTATSTTTLHLFFTLKRIEMS